MIISNIESLINSEIGKERINLGNRYFIKRLVH